MIGNSEGKETDLHLSLDGMTEFQTRVLEVLIRIPRGRVTTYREVAKALGNTGLTRAVGNAVRRNPYPIKIPCHRVVRSSGEIGGFDGALAGEKVDRKIKLLKEEGVQVDSSGRIDLQEFLFKGEELAKLAKRA